jgi:hypothetical protein
LSACLSCTLSSRSGKSPNSSSNWFFSKFITPF